VEPSVAIAKQILRDAMRRQLAAFPRHEQEAASAKICERLQNAAEWRGTGTLLGYLAMPGEPDILAALRAAALHREVAIPRWNPDRLRYEAARLLSGTPLVAGPYGVLEPTLDEETIPFERLDLILVPGLAFDRCGRRLGRGKGFFDRLLACALHARRWGIAFDLQMVSEVPSAAHDVNLHLVVTPESWLPGACGDLPD
jgi:5-formyltetrahydrofolate cyclo-ligase